MRVSTIALLLCVAVRSDSAPLRPYGDEAYRARKHLEALTEFLAAEVTKGKPTPAVPNEALAGLLAFIKKQKDDDALRKETIKLAKKYARVPKRREGADADYQADNHAVSRLEVAWRLLWETGVLKNGMTVDQAAAVLGEPTHRDEAAVYWECPTGRRFGFMLTGILGREGVIAAFRGIH
jgi:hypothetical protein